ncbi:MAG: M28 family peptidase [Cellulosilyticaceae bacterium]
MNRRLKLTALVMGCALLVNSVLPMQTIGQEHVTIERAQKAYLEKVDVNYGYELAKRLETYKSNETLGYRTAGSEAELQTGEMLYEEMKKIGLQDVSKDEFTLDTWTFEKATLSFQDQKGTSYVFDLGGYQTQFDTEGEKQFELVYAGRGTAEDLEDIDVTGKLVMVDLNQRDEWWINYPTYQAHIKGAAAVIAVQDGGYGEISEDALNAQDICGPADAPAFSMSQTDAKVLKQALKNEKDGSLTVTFDAKSEVGFDGKSYNIVGKIPGKDPESMILLSAHYDSYFAGFQDDNAAIGLMMGIAKAVLDSGYQPEKTLVFCAMAAEEWGVSNTRYDWSTGAYNQIFRVRPEWVGKVVANINFELPAYAHGETDDIRSVYEYKTFLEEVITNVPEVEGAYKEGIRVIAPIQSWSDDFSMAIAGVPSMRNDFSGTFMEERYHSQFDDVNTYDEASFLFHHNLYGMLLMAYDRVAVAPLDFTVRLEAMKESLNQELLKQQNIQAGGLVKAIDEAVQSAQAVSGKVQQINDAYDKALEMGDMQLAGEIYQESRELNSQLLSVFKYAEDHFVRLTWEDESIFPHESAQNNLGNILLAVEALEEGDVVTALDEYVIGVDNNWYAYAFDQEVFEYFTNYVLNQPADRLMWGAGRVMGHENLFGVVKSLLSKYEAVDADLTEEINALQVAKQNQRGQLQKAIIEETNRVKEMNQVLQILVK